MRSNGEAGIVPLRAMTAGETLDAAVALLRRRALPLLSLALPLAAAEQALLYGLRSTAGMDPPYYYWPLRVTEAQWWPVVGTGFAAEAFIIAVLGAYAGAAAGPALLGRPAGHRDVWKRSRMPAALPIAVLLAALAGAAALAGFVLWPLVYGMTGLATAILTVDRVRNPLAALSRSVGRCTRGGLRGVGVRLLGYGTWLVVRLALGSGWIWVADLFTSMSASPWLDLLVPVAWALTNTVAYAALGCLDAVLLLEIRIRTEGLDIAVNRARSLGRDEATALVAAR